MGGRGLTASFGADAAAQTETSLHMVHPPADPSTTPPAQKARAGVVRQVLANKGFVACVIVLMTFAISFDVLAWAKKIQFKKLPVPLKKPLSLLDQSQLRQPLFKMNGDLRPRLYEGRLDGRLLEAFHRHGIDLDAEAQVEVKEEGRRWQVSGRVGGSQAARTFLIESVPANGHLAVYSPYRLQYAVEIKPEVLDGLGTDQYIQWTLVDDSQVEDARNLLQLFVTYYTGAPDQVPHVPEECYVGGGGYQVIRESLLDVPVPGLGEHETVRVKVLDMQSPSSLVTGSKVVMYVFHTNGAFCADRNCVRSAMASLLERHAYFSKLELTFGLQDALPPREEALEAGKRFLGVVIPILVRDHWPNWDEVLQAERREQTESPNGGK